MECDVVEVKPLEDFRLYVELANGRRGVFDMTPYLGFGAYKALKDRGYFRQVSIQWGVLTWPNEQDIAPETLLAEMVDVAPIPASTP